MNLILLYGPPAAGKLTIAKELESITGYTLLDNHRATDYLLDLFPRNNTKYEEPRAVLGRKIRLLLFEAAAENNVSIITTFAPLADGAHEYISSIKQSVERTNGKVLIVQLLPNQQALEERVVGKTRVGGKVQTVKRLKELMITYPVMFKTFKDLEQLVVDNSTMQPGDVAKQIIYHYGIGSDLKRNH